MKRQRARLHVVAPAPASPHQGGLTGPQAAKLQSLAAALDLEEPELVRALLAEELPTAQPGRPGDLAAMVASQPLCVVCANRHDEASFHARLERAARYTGCASAQEYVSQLLHLTLWADEREMVVHPRTGKVVGKEADWQQLRFLLEAGTLPVPQAEAA